jgi:hypothetical protein
LGDGILLSGHNPIGHGDNESLERTIVRNGMRIAPPEYLLVNAAREGDLILVRAISAKFDLDCKFIDEVLVLDRDRWNPPEWSRTADNLRGIRP